MLNHNEQLRNPASGPADPQHDAHRVISDEWLQRAIAGIRQMHLNEDARREVAQRLFSQRDAERIATTNCTIRRTAP
ncbi:UNVERIFIED_ORG: hypothetical protein J2Y81_002307 [Paraburkholderia sediminicola]|nr:hypothetical protein [Paraburkholderia sediminicola]